MAERKFDAEAPDPTSSDGSTQHVEGMPKNQTAAKLRNPLIGMSESDVIADVDKWVEAKGLEAHRDAFHKGGLIARVQHQDNAFEGIGMLSADEKQVLRDEITHKWRHPFKLYFLCVLCAGELLDLRRLR